MKEDPIGQADEQIDEMLKDLEEGDPNQIENLDKELEEAVNEMEGKEAVDPDLAADLEDPLDEGNDLLDKLDQEVSDAQAAEGNPLEQAAGELEDSEQVDNEMMQGLEKEIQDMEKDGLNDLEAEINEATEGQGEASLENLLKDLEGNEETKDKDVENMNEQELEKYFDDMLKSEEEAGGAGLKVGKTLNPAAVEKAE